MRKALRLRFRLLNSDVVFAVTKSVAAAGRHLVDQLTPYFSVKSTHRLSIGAQH